MQYRLQVCALLVSFILSHTHSSKVYLSLLDRAAPSASHAYRRNGRARTGYAPAPNVSNIAVAHSDSEPRSLTPNVAGTAAARQEPRFAKFTRFIVVFLVRYTLDVMKIILRLLKVPLALSVILWGCFFLSTLGLAYVSTTVSSFVDAIAQPMCTLPLVPTVFHFCDIDSRQPHSTMFANFAGLMDVQRDSLEVLLEESVGMSVTGWEIKRSEIATNDLIVLVKLSKLKCRLILTDALEDFLRKARRASDNLKRLDSRVSFLIDRCVTLSRSIQAILTSYTSTLAINQLALNTLVAAVEDRFLGAVSPSFDASQVVIEKSFTIALDKFVSRLSQILIHCQEMIDELEAMDTALALIHEIVSRERLGIIDTRDELLARLWTILGGNKHELRSLENHLTLLYGLSQYRKVALAHVHRTMETVEKLEADIAQLREECVTTMVGIGTLDMQYQLVSLRAGITRLADGRGRASAAMLSVRQGLGDNFDDE
jgi:hypothetical protein